MPCRGHRPVRGGGRGRQDSRGPFRKPSEGRRPRLARSTQRCGAMIVSQFPPRCAPPPSARSSLYPVPHAVAVIVAALAAIVAAFAVVMAALAEWSSLPPLPCCRDGRPCGSHCRAPLPPPARLPSDELGVAIELDLTPPAAAAPVVAAPAAAALVDAPAAAAPAEDASTLPDNEGDAMHPRLSLITFVAVVSREFPQSP